MTSKGTGTGKSKCEGRYLRSFTAFRMTAWERLRDAYGDDGWGYGYGGYRSAMATVKAKIQGFRFALCAAVEMAAVWGVG